MCHLLEKHKSSENSMKFGIFIRKYQHYHTRKQHLIDKSMIKDEYICENQNIKWSSIFNTKSK